MVLYDRRMLLMIDLKQVTKRYGAFEAVSGLCLHVPRGQIVGLLGQNGAGKTTTLNILTGYMPPTEGQVLVGGMDMLTRPRECKRLIGYLPEKPPLYDEMTVQSYLSFVCELKEVAHRAIKPHIAKIMETCGLTEVRGRVIGHLSKGYRQRVGLAQALCGDPELLVLDEPTVGLDPRQVVEIRQLIRELGQKHTVIFSSHLLSEVQQLCQQVIILHQGKMIRHQDMTQLEDEGMMKLRAVIAMPEHQLLPALLSLPCVRRATPHPCQTEGACEVTIDCDPLAQPDAETQLFRLLCGLDAPLRMLTRERSSLEDVFLRATAGDE